MEKTKSEIILENDYKGCKLWEMCKMKQKEEGISDNNINKNIDTLEDAISYSIDYLEKIETILPKFTMHGYKHSFNVLELMGKLLINMKVIYEKDGQEKIKLTSYEIALLILSAFFHDIGMSVDGLLEDVEIERGYTTFKKNNMLDDEKKLFLKYIRAMHHERVKEFVNKYVKDNNNKLIWIEKNGNRIQIKSDLIIICKSHNMGEKDLREISANLKRDNKFCAIILRLADILDLDNTRAPLDKMENIKFENTPEDKYSWDEWRKHLQTEGFVFDDEHETITLHGNTNVPEISQKIEYMLEIIRKEIDLCREILPTVSVSFRDCRLPVKVKNGVNMEGFVSGDYSFHIDTSEALNLFMGEKLYMNDMVFVRELLQNAIDSTIYYGKLEKKESFDSVHIYVWKNENEEVYFGIEDRGMGMDNDIIENFFLNIGKSFYVSTQFEKSEVKFTPISKFGIGFLTSFLVAEEVNVLTRHYKEEKILRQLTLNINMKQYILRIDNEENNNYQIPHDTDNKLLNEKMYEDNYPGTIITFKIKPEIVNGNIEEIEKAIRDYSFGVPVPIEVDILGKQIQFKGLEDEYMNQQSVRLNKKTIGKVLYGDIETLGEQDDIIFESVPLIIDYQNMEGKINGNIQIMTVFDTKEDPNLYAFSIEPDYSEDLLYIKFGNYKERIENTHLNAKYEQFGISKKIKVYFNGINHLVYSSEHGVSVQKAYFNGYILLEGNFRPEVDVARSGRGYLKFEALAGLNYAYWKALNEYVGDDVIKKKVYFSIEPPDLLKKMNNIYKICDVYNSIIKYDWDMFDIIKTNLGYLSIEKIEDILKVERERNIELLEDVSINERLEFRDYLIRFLLQKKFKIVIKIQKKGSKVYIKKLEKEEMFDNSHFLPLFFVEYDGFQALKFTNYPLNNRHWFSDWLKGKSKEERFSRYFQLIIQDLEKNLNGNSAERIAIISEINKILNREKEERSLKISDINIWEKENDDMRVWLEIL